MAVSPPTLDLSGHVAVVTGANHGIGAATAVTLATAGAAVLLTYLQLDVIPDPGLPDLYSTRRAADASEVTEVIAGLGGTAVALEADLSDPDTPEQVFDHAESELGQVDILVNNASAWVADSFAGHHSDRLERELRRVSADSFDRVVAVDARGSALMIAEYAERHRRHGLEWGRIIGITSGGPHGFPEEVSYGAAKAALENFTMSAAFELADRGITANVVHPPVTDTGWVTDEVRRHVEQDPGLLHVAEPGEVAEVIVYLCSDRARLITANRIELR